MSMTGEVSLRLQAERREALRKQRVRQACTATHQRLSAALQIAAEPAVERFLAKARPALTTALANARQAIAETPDAAREQLAQVDQQWIQVNARARAAAKQWQAERARCFEAVEAAHGRLSDARETLAAIPEPAAQALADARRAAPSGDEAAVRGHLRQMDAALDAAHAAATQEAERKAVVKGLLHTLRTLGFQTRRPALKGGLVVLEGTLPSGRTAVFEVTLDGQLAFDLHGYEGRACKADLDQVSAELVTRFGVQMGPPQFEWTNPDKISKGAQDLPGGGHTHGGNR